MDLSFEELFRSEVAYVHRTLLRLGVLPADVPDGVQDVFVAVHAKLAECDRSRPVRPWLFVFAHYHAANYRRLRRHQRERPEASAPEPHSATADPERALVAREARDVVLRALDALPEDRRAIFVACELDELSPREVAERLGIPLGTVYSRLRTAREEFTVAARRLARAADSRDLP